MDAEQAAGGAPPRDWGHMAVVALVACVCIAYLYDAVQASPTIDNLILILPAAVVALALCTIIALAILRRRAARTVVPSLGRTPALMGLFALYIIMLPFIGFDVGSAVFVAAALLVDGERRPLHLVLIPCLFAVAVTLGFGALIPYPIPTLLL